MQLGDVITIPQQRFKKNESTMEFHSELSGIVVDIKKNGAFVLDFQSYYDSSYSPTDFEVSEHFIGQNHIILDWNDNSEPGWNPKRIKYKFRKERLAEIIFKFLLRK